ncbi:hypothetical protein QJS04_geneDACA004754 [Acorus gramineus]|uniref:Uncharacterized protein n=1 Tax=Acorus gramineus TaxID=55184 RepID=A0AAV9BT39_ACOGR|nr:hypothetical protein QJS04_geneDACA004754 [Acorus gramineus]
MTGFSKAWCSIWRTFGTTLPGEREAYYCVAGSDPGRGVTGGQGSQDSIVP